MGAGRVGSNWVWFGFDLIQHEFIDTEEHWIFTEALKMGERLVGDFCGREKGRKGRRAK